MTDFIFMVRDTSYMFVTGPDVVKTVTNEVVTAEELGGASVHTTKSGVADGAFENDVECLLQMRRLIDFLPANNESGVPDWPTQDPAEREDKSLDTLIPNVRIVGDQGVERFVLALGGILRRPVRHAALVVGGQEVDQPAHLQQTLDVVLEGAVGDARLGGVHRRAAQLLSLI